MLDVNDNAPDFGRSAYSADVSEDAVEGSQVLTVDRRSRLGSFFRKESYFPRGSSISRQKFLFFLE